MQLVARPELDAAQRLLGDAGLPVTDLTPALMDDFIGLRDGSRWTGLVGIERFGEVALLRSLVVTPECRGRGQGRRLLDAAEAHARACSVRTLYLLTETAADFFAATGYDPTEREAAPEAIRSSSEFSDLCPASAVLMSKALAR